MTITEQVHDLSAKWDREPPASAEVIGKLISESRLKLPEDYLAFLLQSNGGEGELGIQPGWFRIWQAEEVIQAGLEHEVPKYAPGFFTFGGNGGGELLAFDTRSGTPWPVVALPCIGLDAKEAIPVAPNFKDFVSQMGKAFQE
ncbi:MAG: hypothetical protein CJBNEKGG_01553 [Prosthecobacter sp.]|nr:hypothetical protein [Prosthecobacter sp.]